MFGNSERIKYLETKVFQLEKAIFQLKYPAPKIGTEVVAFQSKEKATLVQCELIPTKLWAWEDEDFHYKFTALTEDKEVVKGFGYRVELYNSKINKTKK